MISVPAPATRAGAPNIPVPRLDQLTRVCADTVAVVRRTHPSGALRWIAGLTAHAPTVLRTRSLTPADAAGRRHGAGFRTPAGRLVVLPGDLTAGAREMYCRNVYFRTGLTVPVGGWVVDLGANAGLFTVLSAVDGARVVAVEAQRGFEPLIHRLVALNGVDPRQVRVEIGLAASADPDVPATGVATDDDRWRNASHADPDRPARISVPELLARHRIDRIGLLKLDIEGGEFSVLDEAGDLSWLSRVDQIAMEVHLDFGSAEPIRDLLLRSGFAVAVTDNDGVSVAAGSSLAAYVYARRVHDGP